MDIKNINEEIAGLRKELSDVYLSKSYAKGLEEQIRGLQVELESKKMESRPHPKLINDKMAMEATEFLVEISRDVFGRKSLPLHKSVRDILTKTPADLSQWVNSSGGYTVQTTVYPILEQLFLQSGGVRKWFNMTEIQGRMQVSSATDQACATFQGATAGLAPSDTAAIDQTTLPLTASTLSPAPLAAIYYLSRQLMYNTATNLVSRIFENLANANTLAEDVTALWGDGTTSFANNYGLAHVGANYVNSVTTATNGKELIPIDVTAQSGKQNPTLDDLIALTTAAQEEASLGQDVGFWMNRTVAAYFRAQKASTSGLYFLDPVVNPVNTEIGRPSFTFMGYPVYIWNRMSTGVSSNGVVELSVDSSGAPHYTTAAIAAATVPIVAFGSFKKAALVGFNRGFAIESSLDYAFGDDLITYKGRSDYGIAWIQYANPALATLSVVGQGS